MDGLVLLGGLALCAGVLALVVLSRTAMPDRLTCARVRVPGGREPAFRARFTSGAVRSISILPIVALATIGAGLVSGAAGVPTDLRVTGSALVLVALLGFAYRARGGAARHFYVAVTPSGMLLRPNHLHVFVPWEAVDEVVMLGQAVETARLGVVLRDRDAVGAGWFDRLHLRLRRPKKLDLTVALEDLDTEPRLFVHAVCYYVENPDHRHAIGTEQELVRLTVIQAEELD
jgi:hypothetical protein